MTVFTAIIGAYDVPKEPLIVTPGWHYIMYTDQPYKSDVWEVRQVKVTGDPARLAREIKIRFDKYTEDDFSLWIDGSFQVSCNLDKFVAGNFKSPFTVMRHPLRDCIYREADECIRQKRGDRKQIESQVEYYRPHVGKKAGLIQSGILMRDRTEGTINFCKEWWNQVEAYSTRDQISFSYVAKLFGWPHSMRFDYRNSREFKFKKHINHDGRNLETSTRV